MMACPPHATCLCCVYLQVSPQLIDVNVLMAVQLLVEAAVAANKTLTNHLHQYILFDFRVWSKSAFPVRIGNGFGTVGARVGSVCVCCLSVTDR